MMKSIKTPRFFTDKKIITPLLTKLIRQDKNLDREAITRKEEDFSRANTSKLRVSRCFSII